MKIDGLLQNRWVIVSVAGAIMGAALGVRHVQGLFLGPVVVTQDWPREAFGIALAIQNLLWGVAQPFTGMIADRYGATKVLISGLALYAVGLIVMAIPSGPLVFTFGNGILIGIALSGTAFGAVYGALSRLFDGNERVWAIAVAGAIGGFGQFCMVPVAHNLITALNWQGAAVTLAIFMVALVPFSVALRDRPGLGIRDAGPDTMSLRESLSQAFRNKSFWLLNVGFTACGFQLAFMATHMPAYLVEKGLSETQAGATLAIIAMTNVIGTYVCARMGGRWSYKDALCLIYALRALAMVIFIALPVTPWSAYLFSGAMGFLWLGTVPLTNGVITRIFGIRYIATLFGFVFFGHQVGGFLGVWLGSVAYDNFHSYDLLWWGSAAIGLFALGLHWLINETSVPGQAKAVGST